MNTKHLFHLLSVCLLLLTFFSCKDDPVNLDVYCADTTTPFSCAEGDPNNWYWIDIPEMKNRQGEPGGIGVRLTGGSDSLVIFMEGGGACFNQFTCNLNNLTSENHTINRFSSWVDNNGEKGIFNFADVRNPFRDWNIVYVPYFSGDLHSGTNSNINVPGGPGNQTFRGFINMTEVLNVIAPYFSNSQDVLLTGESAGGVGTLFNYAQVHDAFPMATVSLIDDSGPLIDLDTAMSVCLQQKWRDLFGYDFPPACGPCNGPNGDGFANLMPYLSSTYPDGNFGFIGSDSDGILRLFYGRGENNCTSNSDMTVPVYKLGFFHLRDSVLIPSAKWSTFSVLNSGIHTFNQKANFYSQTATVGGNTLNLYSWCDSVVNGNIIHAE